MKPGLLFLFLFLFIFFPSVAFAQTPALPSCPEHSSYDPAGKVCRCSEGYYVSGSACASYASYCSELLGTYSFYNKDRQVCECHEGYVVDPDTKKCLEATQYCINTYGSGAVWEYGKEACGCASGWVINPDTKKCQVSTRYCREKYGNAFWDEKTGRCSCLGGNGLNKENRCVSLDEICHGEIGEMSSFDGPTAQCICFAGYVIRNGSCVLVTPTALPSTPTTVPTTVPPTRGPTVPVSALYGLKINSLLRMGSQGKEVEMLQRGLANDVSLYPEGAVTGYFGPSTQRALLRFQDKFRLPLTGETDKATVAAFNRLFVKAQKKDALPAKAVAKPKSFFGRLIGFIKKWL